MTEYKICWNGDKTVGVIVSEDEERLGLTYELRKGALNTLGAVTPDFMEAWGDMTAEDNCTIEAVQLRPVLQPENEPPRKPPELLTGAEHKDLLTEAEVLQADLERNDLGGFSNGNRPFWILHVFKRVIEKYGRRDVGLTWSKNELDAIGKKEGTA